MAGIFQGLVVYFHYSEHANMLFCIMHFSFGDLRTEMITFLML